MDIRRPEINGGKKICLKKLGEKIFGEKTFGEKFFGGENNLAKKKFHRDRFSRLRKTCNQRFVDNNYNSIY